MVIYKISMTTSAALLFFPEAKVDIVAPEDDKKPKELTRQN